MDFVTGLPPSGEKRYDAILMMVNRLTKMRHYIPCVAKDEGITAEKTAKMLIDNV